MISRDSADAATHQLSLRLRMTCDTVSITHNTPPLPPLVLPLLMLMLSITLMHDPHTHHTPNCLIALPLCGSLSAAAYDARVGHMPTPTRILPNPTHYTCPPLSLIHI